MNLEENLEENIGNGYYLESGEMTLKFLLKYKIILYRLKVLPTDLINYIIDEYIDVRFPCEICLYILDCDWYYRSCDDCNKLMCENCMCSVSDDYLPYHICSLCYDEQEPQRLQDEKDEAERSYQEYLRLNPPGGYDRNDPYNYNKYGEFIEDYLIRKGL